MPKKQVGACTCCGTCTGTICVTLAPPTDRCTGAVAGVRTAGVQSLTTGTPSSGSVEPSGTRCFTVPGGANYRVTGNFAKTGGGNGGYGYTTIASVAVACGATVSVSPVLTGGCSCLDSPNTVNVTVTYLNGDTAATYGHAYQDSTLQYYCGGSDIPSYLPLSAFTGPGHYSIASWVDDNGFTNYYMMPCTGIGYSLAPGQGAGGLWQNPGAVYNWPVGGSGVNTCTPFGLFQGSVQAGVPISIKFTATG